jgi:acyl-CoA thioester hydrolase
MGVVYHTNFLIYFEVGRTDYFRQFGWTYRQMEKDNIFMPVTECFCQFLQPAKYDDELEISTTLEMLSRLKLKFSYRVHRRGDPNLIAEGYTIHVPTNAAGKPCRIPAIYQEALKSP